MAKPIGFALSLTFSVSRQCEHTALRRWRPSHPNPMQTTCRTFTSAQPRSLAHNSRPVMRRRAQPSMALTQKKARQDALARGEIPDDMGLLPDTFIMPPSTSSKRPGLFTSSDARKNRLAMEWKRFKLRLGELTSALVYKWTLRKAKPPARLDYQRLPNIAKQLHRDIFSAFAAGKIESVQQRVCTGMYGNLQRRLAKRKAERHPSDFMKWNVQTYLSPPKVVSYKAAMFPQQKGAKGKNDLGGRHGLIQAVVKIHTRQSVQWMRKVQKQEGQKVTTQEVPVGDDGPAPDVPLGQEIPTKEVLEYFVVQKSLRSGVEGQWKAWGAAEETSYEDLKEDRDKAKKTI